MDMGFVEADTGRLLTSEDGDRDSFSLNCLMYKWIEVPISYASIQ